MGLGDYPLGDGALGFDPPLVGQPGYGDAADALLFDLESRTFVTDGDGNLVAVHPVDADVALALGFEFGSIAAAPAEGAEANRLRRVSQAAAQSVTTDVVRVALKRLIDAGDIELLGVETDTRIRGRILVGVDYWNLRLSPRPAAPTRITFTR